MVRFELKLAMALTLVACTGTRTGNPGGDPPEYMGTGRFSADPPAGGHTGEGGGSEWQRGNAIEAESAVLRDGRLIAITGGGLVIYDASGPGAPVVLGELPIHGTPLQLDVDETGATVLVYERTAVDATTVPPRPLPQVTPRLVRIDLSDVSRPRRVAAVDLSERIWHFARRQQSYFVLEELTEPEEPMCPAYGIGEIGRPPVPPRAMRVTRYDLQGGEFIRQDAIDLAADQSFAWLAGDAYFAADRYLAPGEGGNASLSWVDFSTGSLAVRGPIALGETLQDVDLRGELLVALTTGTGARLRVFTLDAQGAATARGSVPIPAGASEVSIAADGLSARVDGAAAAIVGLSDLDAPVVLSELPAEVERVFEVPGGLLGLGSTRPGSEAGDGALVVTLWDASDPAAPQRLDRLVTEWPVGTGPYDVSYRVDADAGVVLFPFSPDDADSLGAVGFDASGFTWNSVQPTRHFASRPLTDGERAFSANYAGLEVFALQPGASTGEPSSTFVENTGLEPPGVFARLSAGDLDLRVREREGDGVFVFDAISRDGGAVHSVELSHRGDALAIVGERVLVLGLEDISECDQYDGMLPVELLPDLGFNPCASHRRAGASLLTLDDEPRLVAQIPLVTHELPAPIDGVRVGHHWLGYFRLADGRAVLLAQRYQHCESQASCAALGVPAYESSGTRGCSSEATEDCGGTFVSTSGAKVTALVYTLEGLDGDEPRLAYHSELPGSYRFNSAWWFDIEGQVLASETGFGLSREDPLYDANGNSVVDEHEEGIVRFFLERVEPDADGRLQALPSINTPGRPVAWLGDQVYSLEPRYEEDDVIATRLHRSQLRVAGAFIDESVELGTSVMDARVDGELLWVLRGPSDFCAEDAESELLAVSLTPGAMEVGEALRLPGWQWYFPLSEPMLQDGDLVVQGGPLSLAGRLAIDRSDPLQPHTLRYFTVLH